MTALGSDILNALQQRQALENHASEAAPDPIDWIARNFYVYDTRQLFEFYPPIERALREALAQYEDDTWVYDLVIWSWIKKSAKSTVIAAVAHYIASTRPHARIALMGNDLRQATSRVGMYLRAAIKIAKSERPQDAFTAAIDVPTRESSDIRYPNGSLVEMLPIDPTGEAGGNHDMVVFSELWGWKHKAHMDMWAEMTISPTRYGRAQRWVDTYAGFRGGSPVLEPLYTDLVKPENQLYDDLEVYAAGKQFATWITRPCLPWQTPDYYASEAKTLTPQQFARMHRNQWTEPTEAFIPAAAWEACATELPTPPDNVWWVFAVDAGVSNDLFAMVGVYRRDVMEDGKRVSYIYPGYVRVWKPPAGGVLDFSGPEAEIRRVLQAYRIVELNYDPYQLHSLMTRLQREAKTHVRPFAQGGDRLKADKQLYDMILEGRLKHDGNPVLTEHVLNADADTNKHDNQLRLVKRDDNLKIDAAVCLSMATYRALYLSIGQIW